MNNIVTTLIKIGASLLFYFAPVASIVYAVIALWAIDWITGVWRSRLAGRSFTSYRLRKSVNKISGYIIAIISAHILNQALLANALNLPSIVAAYIGITEVTSIYENLSDITGKKLLKDIATDISNHIKTKLK